MPSSTIHHLKTLHEHANEALKPALQRQLSPAERIALYKRFMKIEEHRIFLKHRAGAGGLEIARNRAELIDVVLSAVLRMTLEDAGDKHVLALVATGGYGRGTLNPRSDIDLLFLVPRASNRLPRPLEEAVQKILYLLWDVGFKVGHACRSIAECVEEAKADQENKTALMDARFIAGDEKLYKEFEKRFDKDCIKKGQGAFFELRRQDLRTRHDRYSRTVFLQEPNVKESCGGQRDYHNIHWVTRVKRGTFDLKKLVEDRLLTATAFQEIEDAYDFLHRVRNELHYATGKGTDQLTLQLQGVVSTNFNYPQRSILRRTEEFMRDYYRHTRNLFQHTTSLMEIFQIEAEDQSDTGGLRSFLTFRKKQREEFDGFIARDGRAYAANPDIFKEDPNRLMRMFQHTQVRGLRLGPPLRKLVKEHWGDIDRPFRYSKANRETFQAILERKGDVARTLRQMHRVGFLGRYLPEFGALDCLVQHEFFHRYTADEHTLRCIEQLDTLTGTDENPKLTLYRRLFHEIEDPYGLYLAVILHDTGRAENVREHIDGSAMLASRLCNRLQIHGTRRTLIMFLVDNHLTFWRTATTRNIEDPDVIAEFASIVKTPALLDALFLFTYADSNGTSPDAWTGWKETLMRQLHSTTRRFLTEGREKYEEALDRERLELRDGVVALMREDYYPDIYRHFELMPPAVFRFRQPAEIVTQVRTIRHFLQRESETGDPFSTCIKWIDHQDKGYTELVLASRDKPLLLEKICCALASEQINILSADFFTRGDGVVVNLLRVCTTNFETVSDLNVRKRILAVFEEILRAESYKPEQYLKRKMNFLKPRTDSGIQVPVRAYVSNDLHPSCTTVEIQALDRIGLLHDLFHAINSHGLNTAHARILTEKGVAMDTLYLTTADGHQVHDHAILRSLEKDLSDLVSRGEAT
ncbi:[protein-PII] uridylyltransferase [Luteolibacter ambystomatis]|uniref:Bifunctional uridylyltransferase/uridylyl-removing enzyme n=1 Tax=Luteolibacter ambystomatis TaxID=2824561 RepID=A0A975PGN0_9BACT|nr:[protein-PII] uridylyltransferase [Luteolibacter ambystomatis]QUE52467.1 [protein-PII] uridylyltransferase [Luteolibacter ambystomatis]